MITNEMSIRCKILKKVELKENERGERRKLQINSFLKVKFQGFWVKSEKRCLEKASQRQDSTAEATHTLWFSWREKSTVSRVRDEGRWGKKKGNEDFLSD